VARSAACTPDYTGRRSPGRTIRSATLTRPPRWFELDGDLRIHLFAILFALGTIHHELELVLEQGMRADHAVVPGDPDRERVPTVLRLGAPPLGGPTIAGRLARCAA
jgi:hypothetical protein